MTDTGEGHLNCGFTKHYGRKPAGDRCSTLQLAFRDDAPTMRLHQVTYDGETKPGASLITRAGWINPVESLEDPRQVFGRDPRAVICNAQ